MGCNTVCAIGGPTMEITSITHFSVENVEKVDPRIDCITRITLNIESRTSGRHCLVLVKPFPPFGRPGPHLARLKSLQKENIESIWVFLASTDERSANGARIEITTTAGERAIFHCKEIPGSA